MHEEYYFAYDTDMDKGVMRQLCPKAAIMNNGILLCYRLGFDQEERATVIQDAGSLTEGIVWRIPENAVCKIDEHKGVSTGKCIREKREIYLRDADKNVIAAFVYISSLPERTEEDIISEAEKIHNLAVRYHFTDIAMGSIIRYNRRRNVVVIPPRIPQERVNAEKK